MPPPFFLIKYATANSTANALTSSKPGICASLVFSSGADIAEGVAVSEGVPVAIGVAVDVDVDALAFILIIP